MQFSEYLVVSVLSVGLALSKPLCGQQKYYDPVVQHCSPCTDICLNANMQGTFEQCRSECPNFQISESKGKTNKETSKTVSANLAAIIIPSVVVFLILFGAIIGYVKRAKVQLLVARIIIPRDPEREANNDIEAEAEMEAINAEHLGAAARRNEEEKPMIAATDDLQAGQSQRGQHKNHFG